MDQTSNTYVFKEPLYNYIGNIGLPFLFFLFTLNFLKIGLLSSISILVVLEILMIVISMFQYTTIYITPETLVLKSKLRKKEIFWRDVTSMYVKQRRFTFYVLVTNSANISIYLMKNHKQFEQLTSQFANLKKTDIDNIMSKFSPIEISRWERQT